MTLVEWAIVIFLFVPLGVLLAAFGVWVTYLQVQEGEGK